MEQYRKDRGLCMLYLQSVMNCYMNFEVKLKTTIKDGCYCELCV